MNTNSVHAFAAGAIGITSIHPKALGRTLWNSMPIYLIALLKSLPSFSWHERHGLDSRSPDRLLDPWQCDVYWTRHHPSFQLKSRRMWNVDIGMVLGDMNWPRRPNGELFSHHVAVQFLFGQELEQFHNTNLIKQGKWKPQANSASRKFCDTEATSHRPNNTPNSALGSGLGTSTGTKRCTNVKTNFWINLWLVQAVQVVRCRRLHLTVQLAKFRKVEIKAYLVQSKRLKVSSRVFDSLHWFRCKNLDTGLCHRSVSSDWKPWSCAPLAKEHHQHLGMWKAAHLLKSLRTGANLDVNPAQNSKGVSANETASASDASCSQKTVCRAKF